MNMGLSLMKNTCYELFNRSAVMEGCTSFTTAERLNKLYIDKIDFDILLNDVNSPRCRCGIFNRSAV